MNISSSDLLKQYYTTATGTEKQETLQYLQGRLNDAPNYIEQVSGSIRFIKENNVCHLLSPLKHRHILTFSIRRL